MSAKARSRTKRDTVPSGSFLDEDELPQTLHEVLESRQLRNQFRTYLRARLADESLLFFECIELYEQIQVNRTHLFERAGKALVKQFVVEESPDWVNIPAGMREELVNTTVFTVESFSAAKTEVFKLMESNFLDSFNKYLMGTELDSTPQLSSLDRSSSTGSPLPSRLQQESRERVSSLFEEIEQGEACACAHPTVFQSGSPQNVKTCASRTSQNRLRAKTKSTTGMKFCCDQRKKFWLARTKKTVGRRARNGSSMLPMKTPSAILRRKTGHEESEKEPKKSGIHRFRLFSRRPSSTRAMQLWQEVGKEQDLAHHCDI